MFTSAFFLFTSTATVRVPAAITWPCHYSRPVPFRRCFFQLTVWSQNPFIQLSAHLPHSFCCWHVYPPSGATSVHVAEGVEGVDGVAGAALQLKQVWRQ
jgi:hypothetical protein